MSSSRTLLRHIVLFAFKPDAPLDTLLARFAELPAAIPAVQAFEYGVEVSPESLAQGFTHAFLLTFADAAARDSYLVHPAHVAFVELVQPQLEKALVFDYFATA